MKNTGFLFVTCAVSFAVYVSMLVTTAATEKLILQGQSLSEQHCSRCHVVGTYNPMGGISSTPSFSIMVNALSDWQNRFTSFYSRPPHPAIILMEEEKWSKNYLPTNQTIRLKYKDIDAIVVFVGTLKKE